MLTRLSGLMLSALLLLPASAAAEPTLQRTKDVPRNVWGYFNGPNEDEGWADISPDYHVCRYGIAQSPIMLVDAKRSAMPMLDITYSTSPIAVEKKDRTMVVDVEGKNTLIDSGTAYTLKQIRLHIPAEHQVFGILNALELHLIHKDKKGNTLIMAIWGKQSDKEHAGLQALLDQFPSVAKTVIKGSFDPASLLPERGGYFAYTGSLTWPPCTEGVEWRIRKQPILISKAQMKIMGKLFGRNSRLLQPPRMSGLKETLH